MKDNNLIRLENQPPIDSEQYVLGGTLQNPKLAEKAIASLNHNNFHDYRNKLIFLACEDLYKQGKPIDEITVHQWLKDKGYVEKVPFTYFGQLRDAFLSEANYDYHVDRVKDASNSRRELELFERIKQARNNGSDTETITDLRGQVKKLWEDGNGSSIKLKPISAKDLPDTQQIDSLWGEIFYPGCITQINSQPGAGKTTILYNLCTYGSRKKDFLCIPFSKPIKTLMLDLETTAWLRRAKLERISSDEELPEDFYFLDRIDLRKDFPDLLALCNQQKYDLVIFDTQSRVLAMEDENSNSEANHLLSLMRQLVNESGCALCLVHHTGKSENSTGVYRGRGASAIAAGVDVVLNLEALDEESIKLTVGKNRIIGTNPVLYLKKAGEDLFQPYTPPGQSSGFELFEAQKFILSLIPNKEWTTGEICEAGEREGFSRSTVERALKRLYEVGKIERPKRGIYRFRQTVTPYWVDGSDGETQYDDFPEYL